LLFIAADMKKIDEAMGKTLSVRAQMATSRIPRRW